MIKRLMDICFSFFGLVVSSPLWLLIILLIYIEDGRPIFFSDYRVGKDRMKYKHYKFRSMIKSAEDGSGPVWSGQQDMRVTRVGKLLRATAMDELPQLWNILRGDMSVVGPRPERPFFVDQFLRYIPGYDQRFSVRPGLTGMAQVYGRYDTSAAKKLEYDLEYIEKSSILLDIKLIIASFLITFRAGWTRFEEKKPNNSK